MKAFFKDTDKIIINSMDASEALVGKQFLLNVSTKDLKVEQRNDINDDFDGLVISITDKEVVNPSFIYVDAVMSILLNDESGLNFNFESTDKLNYILCDFDLDKLSGLFNFLKDNGYTDLNASVVNGVSGVPTGEVITKTYTLPKGTLEFHRVQDSSSRYFNNEMILEFTEVSGE